MEFRVRFLEFLYFCAFALYMVRSFIWTTMFGVQGLEKYDLFLHLFLLTIIIARYVTTILDKRVASKHILLMLVISVVFLMSWKILAYNEILDLLLLILGAYQIDYRKICKVYLCVSVPLTLYTIVASQVGLVTNLIYNQSGRIRESFGFGYPTDFAARIFFMIVAWVLLRQIHCTIIELTVMVAIVLFLHFNCDTRCSEWSILLIVCGVIYLKIRKQIADKKGIIYTPSVCWKYFCLISPFVFASVMILLCRFYNPENSVMAFLNKILSQRLKYGKKTFDHYDTTLFGQYIEMMGNGSTTEKPSDYTFIDCSYINILMRFGLLMFVVVLLIIEVIMLRNINNFYLLGLVVIVCLHSAIEHHLFEYYYNFLLLLPLASFAPKAPEDKGSAPLDKKIIDIYV